MRPLLLTGATGFVGRHILRHLRRRHVPVRIVIRRGSEHRLERIEGLERVVVADDLFAEDAAWWRSA